MTAAFEDTTTRTAQIREPIPEAALETFEGGLLYALIADDNPYGPSVTGKLYLGAEEFEGESFLTFGGDLEDLARWVERAGEAKSDVAKRLLPSLVDGYRRQSANADDYASFRMTGFAAPDGSTVSISIPEIMQALLIHHGNVLDHDFLTLTGTAMTKNGTPSSYGVYVTADAIETGPDEAWLDERVAEATNAKAAKI
jgi:hypothetical protein